MMQQLAFWICLTDHFLAYVINRLSAYTCVEKLAIWVDLLYLPSLSESDEGCVDGTRDLQFKVVISDQLTAIARKADSEL